MWKLEIAFSYVSYYVHVNILNWFGRIVRKHSMRKTPFISWRQHATLEACCTAISPTEQPKQLANTEGRADDGMEILLFSPSMSGSPCYTEFLLVYLTHTDKI